MYELFLICIIMSCRRFSHNHLAQMKYILPEAIEIKRVLVFDERTCCMRPDLHVTLNVNAVEYAESLKSESKNIGLRKVFRARLADFYKNHPEVFWFLLWMLIASYSLLALLDNNLAFLFNRMFIELYC